LLSPAERFFKMARRVSAQLRLFPLMKPLVERFGHAFFKAAPREPGVYVMRGGERILYIGQSKNLRTRLAYYKNANPDRMPRRLVQLVHQVEHISWECCTSAEAARESELELLRLHRPQFNRADVGPQFFHFVQIEKETNCVHIRIHEHEPLEGNCHGPIRGKMIPSLALAGLQRLWIANSRQLARCAELPIIPKKMNSLTIESESEMLIALAAFFQGRSDAIVTTLLTQTNPTAEAPLRQLQEVDAELLLSWWRLLAEGA
jgi:excinuclease UvrABC nuclease subunit